MIASTRFTGTSHYPAVFCVLTVDANMWWLKSRLWGQRIAHVCVRLDEEKPVRPWATGRSRAPAREYPGAPARLRVRRISMAAAPALADPGSSGCRGMAAGARPGSDSRKRAQSLLPQRPLQQQHQQQRASHSPRGRTIGDSRGICPEPDRLSLAHCVPSRVLASMSKAGSNSYAEVVTCMICGTWRRSRKRVDQ